MKCLSLICLSTLFWLSGTIAQPAFPIYGQWNKSTHYFMWGGHGQPYVEDIINYIYHINGSVSSGSNTYYKLYNGNNFATYIKTTEDQTWFGNDTAALQPLFDYTLQVGDTFSFPYSTGFGGVTKLTVTQIDEVMVAGTLRKRIAFSNFYANSCGPVWIKGIGDSKFGGLEFDYAYTVWDMNYSDIECFSENGQAVFGNCTVGMQDTHENATFCTYNPQKQNLCISLQQGRAALLEIYSVTGVKILETNINNTTTNVPLIAYNHGLYIIRITQGSRSQTQKFIKR